MSDHCCTSENSDSFDRTHIGNSGHSVAVAMIAPQGWNWNMFSQWVTCCWRSTDRQRGGLAPAGKRHHLDLHILDSQGDGRIKERRRVPASQAGDRVRSDLANTSPPTEPGAVGCRGETRSHLTYKIIRGGRRPVASLLS